MLKTSTLIAALGTIVHGSFWSCVNFHLIELEYGKHTDLINWMQVVLPVSLIQFFVVFFIKLSATKK